MLMIDPQPRLHIPGAIACIRRNALFKLISTARSRLVRVGSTIWVGHVDLADDHRRSVGLAIVTYMILDAPKES